MSLLDSALAFVFLECDSIVQQRRFCEDGLCLKVVENQFHLPHHHHGLVKYDARSCILALNARRGGTLSDEEHEDGITIGLLVSNRKSMIDRLRALGLAGSAKRHFALEDPNGHRFGIHAAPRGFAGHTQTSIANLRLSSCDLALSTSFYADTLGLRISEVTPALTRIRTPTLDFLLTRAPAKMHMRHDRKLLVFHSPNIEADVEILTRRGVSFRLPVSRSEIGCTVQFSDPTGHRFCLYQPSVAALRWDSGPKLLSLIGSRL